jgi:hypothetical protein
METVSRKIAIQWPVGLRDCWFSVLLVRSGVLVWPVQRGLRRGGVALPCTRAGPQRFRRISMIVPTTAAILKNRTAYQFFCDGRGGDMLFLSTLSCTTYPVRMCRHETCPIDRSSSRSTTASPMVQPHALPEPWVESERRSAPVMSTPLVGGRSFEEGGGAPGGDKSPAPRAQDEGEEHEAGRD